MRGRRSKISDPPTDFFYPVPLEKSLTIMWVPFATETNEEADFLMSNLHSTRGSNHTRESSRTLRTPHLISPHGLRSFIVFECAKVAGPHFLANNSLHVVNSSWVLFLLLN